MTSKVYKTAMGKTIDLGALMLENEHVRAVGNMKVNARGDLLDPDNRVIEPKARQVQKQYAKQQSKSTEMANTPVVSSTRAAKERRKQQQVEEELDIDEIIPEKVAEPAPVESASASIPRGGLAAAIARSREVTQELVKTPRQLAQERSGVKKI